MRTNKASYDLKQCSKKLNEKLRSILLKLCFKQLISDQYVYVFFHKDVWMIVAGYVNDKIVITNSPVLKKQLVDKLQLNLTIKSLEELKHFYSI